MPNRSRMAAIAVAIAAGLGPAVLRADESPVANRVNLQLQIVGLGQEGCEVEVKPAHSECKFDKVVKKVDRVPAGAVRIDLPIDAQTTHADRDCSFAITIREPGRPARTYRRGLRLAQAAPGMPAQPQTYNCALSTASLAAKQDPASKTRR